MQSPRHRMTYHGTRQVNLVSSCRLCLLPSTSLSREGPWFELLPGFRYSYQRSLFLYAFIQEYLYAKYSVLMIGSLSSLSYATTSPYLVLTNMIAAHPHRLRRYNRSCRPNRPRSPHRVYPYRPSWRCRSPRSSRPNLTTIRRHVVCVGQDFFLNQSHAPSSPTIYPSIPMVHRHQYAYAAYSHFHYCLC